MQNNLKCKWACQAELHLNVLLHILFFLEIETLIAFKIHSDLNYITNKRNIINVLTSSSCLQISWKLAHELIAQSTSIDMIVWISPLENEIPPTNSNTYSTFLQEYRNSKSLTHGNKVHSHTIQDWSNPTKIFMRNHLVEMYVKCGSLRDKCVTSIFKPCAFSLLESTSNSMKGDNVSCRLQNLIYERLKLCI